MDQFLLHVTESWGSVLLLWEHLAENLAEWMPVLGPMHVC